MIQQNCLGVPYVGFKDVYDSHTDSWNAKVATSHEGKRKFLLLEDHVNDLIHWKSHAAKWITLDIFELLWENPNVAIIV